MLLPDPGGDFRNARPVLGVQRSLPMFEKQYGDALVSSVLWDRSIGLPDNYTGATFLQRLVLVGHRIDSLSTQ